jgi:hypothetical protein
LAITDRSIFYASLYGPSHILLNDSLLIGYIKGSPTKDGIDRLNDLTRSCFEISKYALASILGLNMIGSAIFKMGFGNTKSLLMSLQVIYGLELLKTYHPTFLDDFM